MGKRLIQQARGKGGPTYRAPSFRYKGKVSQKSLTAAPLKGEVLDIIHCQGHSSPLIVIKYEDGEVLPAIAPEGIRVGDSVVSGVEAPIENGNSLVLKNIPEGTLIHNIESRPGDGGKFVRASGTAARIESKAGGKITIVLPSKKKKIFDPMCKASIGLAAGGGRLEKPLLKAGRAHFKYKAKNKLWPKVCGISMNAVDHPHGGKSSHHKGRPTIARKNAPPGAKVGMIRARRTGRKKR